MTVNGNIHGSRSRIQGSNTRNVGLSLLPCLDNIIQDIGDSIDLDSLKKRIAKKNTLDPMFGDSFRSLKRISTRHGLIACYVIRMSITWK
jgi:hypothetical protein